MKADPTRRKFRDPNRGAAQTKTLDILEDNFDLFLLQMNMTQKDFVRPGPASFHVKSARRAFIKRSLNLGFMCWEIQFVTGLGASTITEYKND